jgi:hypothetical protein
MGGSENEARRLPTICDQVRPNRLPEHETGKMRRSNGSSGAAEPCAAARFAIAGRRAAGKIFSGISSRCRAQRAIFC